MECLCACYVMFSIMTDSEFLYMLWDICVCVYYVMYSIIIVGKFLYMLWDVCVCIMQFTAM